MKTDKGWLVLYHGVEHGGKGYYRVGALLLDLENPLRIIARTPLIVSWSLNLNMRHPVIITVVYSLPEMLLLITRYLFIMEVPTNMFVWRHVN